MAKLTLDIDLAGRGTLMLDGQPLQNAVSGVHIVVAAGETTKATVTLDAVDVQGGVEVDALAMVVRSTRNGMEHRRKIKRVEFEDGTVFDADKQETWTEGEDSPPAPPSDTTSTKV